MQAKKENKVEGGWELHAELLNNNGHHGNGQLHITPLEEGKKRKTVPNPLIHAHLFHNSTLNLQTRALRQTGTTHLHIKHSTPEMLDF